MHSEFKCSYCSTLYTVYTQAASPQNPPPAALKQDLITVLMSVSPFFGERGWGGRGGASPAFCFT